MSNRPDNQPEKDEELASSDDAVIGRAVRVSAAAIVIAAIGVALGFFLLHRKPPPEQPKVTTLTPPTEQAQPTAETPVAKFTDITASAGIHFTHQNGAYGDKLLPESMGGGVAFLDYDNDGKQDLLFINST